LADGTATAAGAWNTQSCWRSTWPCFTWGRQTQAPAEEWEREKEKEREREEGVWRHQW